MQKYKMIIKLDTYKKCRQVMEVKYGKRAQKGKASQISTVNDIVGIF